MDGYAKAAANGVNPFNVPVVVDIGASPSFRTVRTDTFPTITRCRANGFNYWVSTKGARVDINELTLLQGFDLTDVDWKGAGATASAFAAALGNAQSLNAVSGVLPHVLYFSKLVTKEEFESMVR